MKPQTALLSFFLFVPNAFAQHAPSEVTDAQLSTYQAQIETGCKNTGHQRGDPKADAFCGCMSRTLQQQVPHSDWQRAYIFAQQGHRAEESTVFRPYLKQLQACM